MPIWGKVIIQSLIALVFMFVLTRILGKRQISQMTFFEYIIGITIGDLAGNVSLEMGGDWYLGLVSLVVWGSIPLGLEYMQIKSRKMRIIVESTPTVLIRDGKILEDNLRKERITNEELVSLLRNKSIFHTREVDYAVIEPSGKFNVMLKRDHRTVTVKDLGLNIESEGLAFEIILDGKIMDSTLSFTGFSRKWVLTKLKERDIRVEDVYLAQCDRQGNLYIDLYEDQIDEVSKDI
ncbi:DUF421 domain-containing protein [Paenibacillus tarimensis]|uniref:DUF421 domain-containing protein n=1 Tax=Paenibacillus tarimensis TaxID=416012 RepID=UPI001F1D3CC1|nr:DUF421 domain-containing protein [Paenibacillus tarimensis]MCF2943200.1 DUF421 domain-containing protein [Paenibacillus tarimensis]